MTYATVEAAHEYPGFRDRIEALCQAPIFQGPRSDRLREQLRPFDEYYQRRAAEESSRGPSEKPRPRFVGRGVV